ncbi:MmgE/PrpD family protein [Roseovarius sp.]|uniref:MmgE/PrpD family protein n=1 Tax=Roseovarius sp. TaxID=1486281 RepID=UPI00263614ED|nr:MmgE/PrpD family protein [Roseovarius sp.]
METAYDPLQYLHDLSPIDIPGDVIGQAEICVLDLLGVAIGGRRTQLSQIIHDHAAEEFRGEVPILLDGRRSSVAGAALAGATTIDSLDGHDGFNPAKGHAGCAVLPATLAFAHLAGVDDGAEVLTAITLGYEYGCRLAMALHGTASDYHTSGAWASVAVAAIGARLLKLSPDQTRHALGIAEYHGPRSQMMRCIDHPTMVKDGSGWGAMAGATAVLLAQKGFTGAPSITVEEAPDHWQDLGQRWLIRHQYFKPYPVCRWAQAPVEAILALRRAHKTREGEVDHIEVASFHQAVRLAANHPRTTEEAQYSTSFPCAVAMVRGRVEPGDLTGRALSNPKVLRLSRSLIMREDDAANRAFPQRRMARVQLHLKSGEVLQSDWHAPRWEADEPPTRAELRAKFHANADPVIGPDRALAIAASIDRLATRGLGQLARHIYQPINS